MSTTCTAPRLVDSTVAALHLRRAYGCRIAPATIRSWAQRGHITRTTGPRPYDLDEIDEVARKRGLTGP